MLCRDCAVTHLCMSYLGLCTYIYFLCIFCFCKCVSSVPCGYMTLWFNTFLALPTTQVCSIVAASPAMEGFSIQYLPFLFFFFKLFLWVCADFYWHDSFVYLYFSLCILVRLTMDVFSPLLAGVGFYNGISTVLITLRGWVCYAARWLVVLPACIPRPPLLLFHFSIYTTLLLSLSSYEYASKWCETR